MPLEGMAPANVGGIATTTTAGGSRGRVASIAPSSAVGRLLASTRPANLPPNHALT